VSDDTRRRSAHDLSGAQTGDVTNRDSAGGDITYHGADAGAVLTFLRDYVFASDQQRETAIKAVSQELRRARDDMGIISDAVRSVRDRLDDDDRERVERQKDHDLFMADMAVQASDQARALRQLRRWVVVLTIALFAFALILAAVVWRLSL
jgi:hypothetical protein